MEFYSNFRDAVRQKYNELTKQGNKPEKNDPVFWGEQIGIKPRRVLSFFHGIDSPTNDELNKISKYFDLSIDWLIGKDNTPPLKIALFKGSKNNIDDDELFETINYAEKIERKYTKN